MRVQTLLILIISVVTFGCSDNSLESRDKITVAQEKIVTGAHERITKDSILADFMNKVSKNRKSQVATLTFRGKVR